MNQYHFHSPLSVFKTFCVFYLSISTIIGAAPIPNAEVAGSNSENNNDNTDNLHFSSPLIITENSLFEKRKRSTYDYQRIAQESIVHQNDARANQQAFIAKLEARGFTSAANYVRLATPCGALAVSNGLTRAAQEHVQEQGQTNEIGHDGPLTGSSLKDRLNRYGKFKVTAAENLAYGSEEALLATARLIDSQSHRVNIFNCAFQKTGIACGPHAKYRIMCVTTFAGDYIEQGQQQAAAAPVVAKPAVVAVPANAATKTTTTIRISGGTSQKSKRLDGVESFSTSFSLPAGIGAKL